jgi:hypothetical protein
MIKLKCPNKRCNYIWEFKGKSKFYTSCRKCRYNVNIRKRRVK